MNSLDSHTQKQIEELQVIEKHLQQFLIQKQTFQLELNEIDNAIAELKKSDDEVYKILGGILIRTKKEDIEAELVEKKRVVELKIVSITKQEQLLAAKSNELRSTINSTMSQSDTQKKR